MTGDELRARQAPLKALYKEQPEAALRTLVGSGTVVTDDIAFQLDTGKGRVLAGQHPATGGPDGEAALACSGDMLLEALAGCAGVTLKAVATAIAFPLRGARVTAEGDIDFRGTLGVSREAPVGFKAIRLRFRLDTDAPDEQAAKLVSLTERYCVVLQTLKSGVPVTAAWERGGS
jgi:uncharacterized OsmC-like protein